jgi:catechol 2,3-dioxygenase-like lactoylglutathione lyase family enzyme
MESAVTFYTGKLGFDVAFRNGGVYTIVRRDGVEIGLALDRTGSRSGRGSCYVKMTGVDSMYSELVANGVAIAHELKNEAYGMREFMVTDPEGNTVNFGEAVP